VNLLALRRKPFLVNLRAMLLKKNDASTPCYARYGAYDAGRCFTANDSPRFSDVNGTRDGDFVPRAVVARVPSQVAKRVVEMKIKRPASQGRVKLAL
jgi:hypothetical protein